jgi:hypothetical protein
MDRVAGPQKMVGTGIFSNIPPCRAFPAAGDRKDRRRQTVPLLRPRPNSVLRCIMPRPQGDLQLSQGWRLLASVVPERCFRAVRRQLQHPRPSADPSVPFFAKKQFSNAAPAPSSGEYLRIFSRGKDISDCPSGRSLCRCTDIVFFQNPPYRASRQLLIRWIAAVGTSFSPLPCQAWHGYMATSAHSVEVEVGADGPASTPLSGAAAAAPLAGTS